MTWDGRFVFKWKGSYNINFQVGARIIDLIFVRDRTAKRELKLLNALLLVYPDLR